MGSAFKMHEFRNVFFGKGIKLSKIFFLVNKKNSFNIKKFYYTNAKYD